MGGAPGGGAPGGGPKNDLYMGKIIINNMSRQTVIIADLTWCCFSVADVLKLAGLPGTHNNNNVRTMQDLLSVK